MSEPINIAGAWFAAIARCQTTKHARFFENGCSSCGNERRRWLAYVVALSMSMRKENLLYLHTGPHHGHFLTNILQNSRICIHVDEPVTLQRGQPSPCDSALVYKSAVAYGQVRVVEEAGASEKKAWFFDRLLERLKEPMSAYERRGIRCWIALFCSRWHSKS